MNKIENDFGKLVWAVGAPGSIARLKVERPALIGSLSGAWYMDGKFSERLNHAQEILRQNNIRPYSRLGWDLLRCSTWGDDPQFIEWLEGTEVTP